MRAREGDFIETYSGLIFDVKGFMHPPGYVIAFLRYYPDPEGTRTRCGVAYQKIYSLEARLEFLKEKYPDFLRFDEVFNRILSEVPTARIKINHEPSIYLGCLAERRALDPVEQDAVNLADKIKMTAEIQSSAIGVTGSVLVRLHNPDSDLDLICYGSKASRRVYSVLEVLRKDPDSLVEPYDEQGLRRLYEFRRKDTEMKYSDFVKVERRKILQGTYNGRDYYVRLIKDYNEAPYKYGGLKYKPLGRATITATVLDDTENIFTPCRYPIREVETSSNPISSIREVVSYRGRFCEQAKKGELILVSGEVEEVKSQSEVYRQIILGNQKEDFLKVIGS
jgi:predicted nucleotidyltransferase